MTVISTVFTIYVTLKFVNVELQLLTGHQFTYYKSVVIDLYYTRYKVEDLVTTTKKG